MEIQNAKILLIGAGKMGGALLGAWVKSGAAQLTVIEQNPAFTHDSVKVYRSLPETSGLTPDVVVIAVKPQSLDELTPLLANEFGAKPLYLSIAAGKTLSYFAKYLGDASIIRAMPNTPALIGKGISALVANSNVNAEQKECATLLLKAAGHIVWLEDESQMDAVTAVSGSGPAYAFLFMDALVQAGIKQGLSEDIAKKLAVETVHGAAELARKMPESLEQLRKNVTSPGGTTEAALKVLMKEDAQQKLIDEAVTAAVKRSKELS
jgi:pyrroline-5-carboxylate reductase